MDKIYKFGSKCSTEPNAVPEDLIYVYSPACKEFKVFTKEEEYIRNKETDVYKAPYNYEYVSAVTAKKYPKGTTVEAVCDFESFGAPLVVLSDDIRREGSRYIYGVHFEVVAYEGGVNVWHITPDPSNVARPIKTSKIAFRKFKIENRERITISVTVEKGKLIVAVNGVELEVEHPDVPDLFHAGFTACEGLNRFYEFKLKDKEDQK